MPHNTNVASVNSTLGGTSQARGGGGGRGGFVRGKGGPKAFSLAARQHSNTQHSRHGKHGSPRPQPGPPNHGFWVPGAIKIEEQQQQQHHTTHHHHHHFG